MRTGGEPTERIRGCSGSKQRRAYAAPALAIMAAPIGDCALAASGSDAMLMSSGGRSVP